MHRSESRETAYIHAINSAALAWSITRACSRGDLTECSCDNSIRRKQRKWQWGGCSEVNIALHFFHTVTTNLIQITEVIVLVGRQLWCIVFKKIH